MIPEALYLKGFAGIRAGMNRDEFSLDLSSLAADARLVALAGPNGAGKTTVMDNLQPYRLLPSRASSFSPAGFSFYEHLVLPECVKVLTWRHAQCRYRSTLVFRMNGRRKSEAYLHTEEGGRWVPVKLADGTLSDGRAETYDACLEALLGKPETFFTSVFAAQNRRPLASYTPGEIKTLMVELLGLEAIRQRGEKASQVARLMKSALDERRRTLGAFGDTEQRIAELRRTACAMPPGAREAQGRQGERAATGRRGARCGSPGSSRNRNRIKPCRRVAAALLRDWPRRETRSRRASAYSTRIAIASSQRLDRSAKELREATSLSRQQQATIAKRRQELQQLLSQRAAIAAATERARTLASDERALQAKLEAMQTRHQEREAKSKSLAVLVAQAESLRRQAGDAALRTAGLRQRFALTATVPCRGTELQSRCELLADAREASQLLPSADEQVLRIRIAVDAIKTEIRALETAIAELGDAAAAVRDAHTEIQTLR